MAHIVIVDTTLTQVSVGGAQSFLVDLCSGLVGRGWNVTVLTTMGPNGAVVAALRSTGAVVEEHVWRPFQLPEDRAQAVAAWMTTAKPNSYVISISPDVGWLALPLVDREVVTVSIAHNDVEAFYAPLRHYEPFVDCAVGVSREIHRRISSECGLPPARVRHIPYGVRSLAPADLAARLSTRSCGGPIRIGYVGRLVQEQKRVLDLVPLLASLESKGVDFTCDVIGDGGDRERLAQGFESLRLTNPPRLWGWLDSAAVRERLAELEVLVLLSSLEGLPVAVLEAMGEAVVPVVTKIASGCVDVVRDGANGFLVHVGDIEAFATRIQWLSENGEQLTRMRRTAWETARVYSTDRMVASYVSLLEAPGAHDIPRAHKPVGQYENMPSCRSPYPRWLRLLKARLTAMRSLC